jgi:hypothetical protein
MASYTQPTGFLAATFPATVSSFAGGVVASVTNGVTLAATQPAITFGALTIDVSGSTPNITLTGSGSGNGIEWTRSGSGNPFDSDVVDQIQSGLSTLDASGVRSAVGLASANLDTQLGDIPTLAEFEARSIVAANYATSSALSTVEGKIDTIDNFIDTEVLAIKAVTDKIDTGLVLDGAVYQFTANMLELGPSGGGGGDATLAKQEEILAAIQGTEVIQVASPNVLGNLVLTQGDDYDGVANPKASWTVTTDYTTGWTVRLTIRDADDAVIYTTTGTVVSATVVAVTIAAPTGLTMTGCPGQWQGKFDVELTHSSGKKKTIALGTCYINEDQTR